MKEKLTIIKIIGGIICFLLLFFGINFWAKISQEILGQKQATLTEELAIANAIQIEHLLTSANASASIVKEALAKKPNQLDDLRPLATTILTNFPVITKIRISPNNVTSHVFPEQDRAIYLGKIIVSPLNSTFKNTSYQQFYSSPTLSNNQYIIKSHIPVTLNDQHWGYITYHINLNTLIKDIQLNQADISQYSYQLVHLGRFKKSIILAKSTTPLQKNYYTAAIQVPNNRWYLKISFNTTSTEPLFYINLFFSVILAAIFTLIGYLGFSDPARLREKIKLVTEQFTSQSLILNLLLDNLHQEIFIADKNGKIYLYNKNAIGNHHLPINLDNIDTVTSSHIICENDGQTRIHPSDHPINKALFNKESVVQQIMIFPQHSTPQLMEITSKPIFNTGNQQIGALCIGERIKVSNAQNSSDLKRNVILEKIAKKQPIKLIFEHIITDIEYDLADVCAAITLISPTDNKISNVIAPNLPVFYSDALIGLAVTERVMSNLSAMAHNELIIAEDISVHPFWVEYKDLAQQANLRSCWSQPIHDFNENVIGSLDIYSNNITQTSPATLLILKESALLCSLALERHNDSQRLQKMTQAIEYDNKSVIITDNKGIISYINPAYCTLTGYWPLDKVGSIIYFLDHQFTPSHLINEINDNLLNLTKWQGELKHDSATGKDFWVSVCITPSVSDNNVTNYVFTLEQTQQPSLSSSIPDTRLLQYPLNCIYSRKTFEHRLKFLLSSITHIDVIHSLCIININEYEHLSQQLGTKATSQLLSHVSHSLSQHLRRSDIIFQLGTDQLVLLMEDCNSIDAMTTLTKLMSVLGQDRFNWQSQRFDITLSIGITEICSNTDCAHTIIQQADIANNKATHSDIESIIIYQDIDNTQPVSRDFYCASQIKIALEQDNLLLYSQPVIAINKPIAQSYDMLIGLSGGDKDSIATDRVLGAAKKYELSLRIDKWLIEKSLMWCESQLQLMEEFDNIFINLSADALIDQAFAYQLSELSTVHTSAFKHLIFQFSEADLLNNLANYQHFVKVLAGTHCQFAVSDFACDLASLNYLADWQLAAVKISGERLEYADDDPIAKATLLAILAMTKALQLDVIISSVDNESIATQLAEYNISHAQGLLFGLPSLIPPKKEL